jgi:hypothetical protein
MPYFSKAPLSFAIHTAVAIESTEESANFKRDWTYAG